MSSKYEELERLADLKEKGIITEEDFDKKKKEILSKGEGDFFSQTLNSAKGLFSGQDGSEKSKDKVRDQVGSSFIGKAGFTLAIISLFTLEISLIRMILMISAIIMSSIGLQKNRPARGFALAGVIISVVSFIWAIGGIAAFYSR